MAKEMGSATYLPTIKAWKVIWYRGGEIVKKTTAKTRGEAKKKLKAWRAQAEARGAEIL